MTAIHHLIAIKMIKVEERYKDRTRVTRQIPISMSASTTLVCVIAFCPFLVMFYKEEM